MNSAVAALQSEMQVPTSPGAACQEQIQLTTLTGTTSFTPQDPGVNTTDCDNASATCSMSPSV